MNSESSFRRQLPSTAQYSGKTDISPADESDFEAEDPGLDRVDRLGRYRVDREIARGGMGVIFQAYDELLHRDVAIKLLQHRFRNRPQLGQRFVNEALLTSRLQHPCIVPIYECGQAEDQRPFFAMKLIAGHSLAQLLALPERGQLERSRLLKVFEQVCQTIAYAHTQSALHLDLKPANIMIGEFGEVHVMDWGLARMRPDEPSPAHARKLLADPSSETSHVYGTAAYMSPEQARGDWVCERTDVFGLGALLCEILTGRPPYRGQSHRRVYARAVAGSLDDACRRLETCGSETYLVDLAKRCLAAEREQRPASAGEVARAIGAYLESALEQAESDLCRFFELSLDLFCIANLAGYFERVNTNFPKVLGYTEAELVSQPFLEFVHPDDVAATAEIMQQLSAGQSVVSFVNRYRSSDGRYLHLEWTARALVDEERVFAVARIRQQMG